MKKSSGYFGSPMGLSPMSILVSGFKSSPMGLTEKSNNQSIPNIEFKFEGKLKLGVKKIPISCIEQLPDGGGEVCKISRVREQISFFEDSKVSEYYYNEAGLKLKNIFLHKIEDQRYVVLFPTGFLINYSIAKN